MPKRSNSFQRLILRLQSALHEDDCTIEESAMIANHVSGNMEEIDILVTFKKGDHVYKTGIACRDHSRPAGPSWIRDLASQRDHCRLDKVIAFHSNGYSRPAIRTAEHVNISTYHLDDVPRIDIERAIGFPDAILTTFADIRPFNVYAELLERASFTSAGDNDSLSIICGGKTIVASSIVEAIRALIKHHALNFVYNGEQLPQLPITHSQISSIEFRGELPDGTLIAGPSGERCAIAAVRGYARVHSGIRYPQIRSRYTIGSHIVLDAESSVFGRRTEMLLAESKEGGTRIHVNAEPGSDVSIGSISYDAPGLPDSPFTTFNLSWVVSTTISGYQGDLTGLDHIDSFR